VAAASTRAAEAEGRSRFWASRAALAEEALARGGGGRAGRPTTASVSGGSAPAVEGEEGEAGSPAGSARSDDAVAVDDDGGASPRRRLLLLADEEEEEGAARARAASVSPSFGDFGATTTPGVGAAAATPATDGASAAAATPATDGASASAAPPAASISGQSDGDCGVVLLASTEKAGASGSRFGRAVRVSLEFGPLADLPTPLVPAVGVSASPSPSPAALRCVPLRPPSAAGGGLRTPLAGLVRRLSGGGGGGSTAKKARRPPARPGTAADAGLKTVAAPLAVVGADKENDAGAAAS
jgi:hypothetical protein